jgi:F-type H+-transporting ATPase subunit delta
MPNASTNSHDTVLDTGAQQVAAVYAKALLGATEQAGQTEAVIEEFNSLVADVLDRLPNFEAVLSSALVSHEEKVQLIDRALGSQASPLLLNFLKVLSAHGRLNVVRAIHRAALALLDQMRGRVRVQVRTATPLDDGQAGRLADQLRAMLGGEPVLEQSIDPQLIGGLWLRVGDTVYDGSISAQLEQMRAQMIHRSIHEIQSRRDRFSHSAGN